MTKALSIKQIDEKAKFILDEITENNNYNYGEAKMIVQEMTNIVNFHFIMDSVLELIEEKK